MIKLALTFVLNSFLIFAATTCYAQKQLNTVDFIDSIKTKDAQLLDVRTADEFNKGSISGAKNLDWNQRELFAEYTRGLDKKKPIYLFCLSGGRSKNAASYLAQEGYTVFELEGGYLKYEQEISDLDKNLKASEDEISLTKFKKLTYSNPKVLVDFHAEWCAPCKLMRPYLEEIEKDTKNGILVVYIDAEKNKNLLKQLGINGIPELQYFTNGELNWQHNGAIEKRDLLDAIQTN